MQEKRSQSEIIECLFKSREVEDLEEYLQSNPDLNLISLTDSQGNNVLHQLAYEGHLELIKLFVRKAIIKFKKKDATKVRNSRDLDFSQINQWLNRRNNEGFTPLLYAAFNGHLNIIKFFVEDHPVDYTVKTNTGLNPLHLAAQKNALMPFLYFKGKLDLFDLDKLGSTPLHWAAYSNSEEVVSYILSETEDLQELNTRDAEGNTALAIAVAYGNTRVVRRLLIKGADRYCANNQGRTPYDIAVDCEFKTITRMLSEQFSVVDLVKFYCNVKIEYKPMRRKKTIPALFIISFLLNMGIINTFISFTEDYALYSEISFMFVMFCFYVSLLWSRPTNDPRAMTSLLDEFNQRSIKKVCFTCKNKIPKRGYHCDTCGVCIEQYDHHCTWINNCVGKRNIARFIIFIVMLVISLGFIGLVAVVATIALAYDDPNKFSEFFTFRYLYQTNADRLCLIGCFLVNEATALFFFPVLLLCVVQIKNLLTNKTTFEKVRGTSTDNQLIKSKINKVGQVSLRNCRVMCADSRSSFSTQRSSFSELITEKHLSEHVEALNRTSN